MNPNRFRLLFFGSDTFSIGVIKYLLEKRTCPISVVTGTGSLLHKFSIKNQLVRYNWPLYSDFPFNEDTSVNIGLVASFGHLIDEKTVKSFKYGLFNVHPSLLPQFRGSTPVQAAILHGLKETGCTIMQIPPVPKFDVGQIVLQERLSILDGEYATELGYRLANLGAVLAEKLINDYEICLEKAYPQPTQGKSLARKLKPESGFIQFMKETSVEVDLKVRAYTGFISLFTHILNGRKIRLEGMIEPGIVEQFNLDALTIRLFHAKGMAIHESITIPPGTIYFHKVRQVLCFKCADTRWLAFKNVTPESKAKMSALDFYNGYLSTVDLNCMRTDV